MQFGRGASICHVDGKHHALAPKPMQHVAGNTSVLFALAIAVLSLFSVTPDQVSANPITTWELRLMGMQEVPTVGGPARGTVHLTFDDATRALTYTINVSGVASELVIGADIHVSGPVGTNGPAKYALLDRGHSNATGRITIDVTDVPGLMNGDEYVSVRTLDSPGGAARAQIEPLVKTIYRMEVNARNKGDAAAVISLFAEDARQVLGDACTEQTPCLTRDGIRFDLETGATENLQITTVNLGVFGETLTAQEEWRSDQIRAAGFDRLIVNVGETLRGDTIVLRRVVYDENDPQTRAFQRLQDNRPTPSTLRPNDLKGQKTPASLGLSDQFNRSGLEGWTWENPGRSSMYAVSGDLFNLVVTPNNDQWVGLNAGPRILKEQPAGAWTIETKLAMSSGNAATFGGLTVFKNEFDWLAFGWLKESSLEFSGVIGGAFTQPIGVSTWNAYLRLRRAGNKYYADSSSDGQNWTNVNMFEDLAGALDGARIGFLGKNWDTLGAYSVSIEYFRENGRNLMPALLDRVESTRRVEQVTGRESPNKTEQVNVCGTDLGVMFTWQDKTYLAFGDTMGCRPFDRPIAEMLTPNRLAFSSDAQPADGLKIDGWILDEHGQARAIFQPDPGGITAIPTAAVSVDDQAYIFYMNVTNWTDEAGWRCDHSGLVSANASDPGLWTKERLSWAPGKFNQLSIVREAGSDSTTLYMFGTACGRQGSIYLMKVEEPDLLNKDAYRYFVGLNADGAPIWSASEASSVSVAGGPAGEMSVVYNAFLGRYVLAYLDVRKGAIVVRDAPAPWGPWSSPVTIARSNEYPQLYGAFMLASLNQDQGRTFYYIMSQFDSYNTYWMETTLPSMLVKSAK